MNAAAEVNAAAGPNALAARNEQAARNAAFARDALEPKFPLMFHVGPGPDAWADIIIKHALQTFPMKSVALIAPNDQGGTDIACVDAEAYRANRAATTSFPKLLLMEEPFPGLAPVWIKQISDAIPQQQARGTTVLMTEQMARPALKPATRGYVMRGGEVRRSGPVDAIRDFALAGEYL